MDRFITSVVGINVNKISGFDLSPVNSYWNFKALDIFSPLKIDLEVKRCQTVLTLGTGEGTLLMYFY